MKFLKSEYDSIKNVIENEGLEYEKFSFTKKRGMLHIQHENRTDSFIFFRKKESVFNEKMKFEEKTTYFVGSKKGLELSKWENVLTEFKKWLT